MATFSVVIPTIDEQGAVARAVDSAWYAGAAEVIVVDGGSVDNTVEQAAASGATVVASPCGRAVQQNIGAKRACGDYLLFLHADTWLDQACGAQLHHKLADLSVAVAAFRQRIDQPGLPYRWLERGNAWRAKWLGMPYGDQAITVRRDLFLEVGGFPEVPFMEDVRLLRVLKRRSKVHLLDGPVHVSGRRWRKHGVVRQTLRNQWLLAAERIGVSPAKLATYYRRQSANQDATSTQPSPSSNVFTDSSASSA